MSRVHEQAVYDSDLYANEQGRRRSRKRFLLAVIAGLTHDSENCDSSSCGGKDDPHPGDFDTTTAGAGRGNRRWLTG